VTEYPEKGHEPTIGITNTVNPVKVFTGCNWGEGDMSTSTDEYISLYFATTQKRCFQMKGITGNLETLLLQINKKSVFYLLNDDVLLQQSRSPNLSATYK
jgi:hypothetical protein